MSTLEPHNTRQDQQKPLFTAPTSTDLETQRHADLLRLLGIWEQSTSLPTVAAAAATAARDALGRGLTPYETLLLYFAPAFLGPDDRALEVIEIDPEPEHG